MSGRKRKKDTGLNLDQPLEDIERDIITILLKQENHNQSKVAKRLGISRSTLWRKLKNDL
ncbi:winged helix-turn-helix transcriptional regulator [Eubacterium sp. BL-380-WT-2B]|uniref:helix-turn-helix domain-containing protein n=1 Tax=Eubacterium sp. BL-380-WT-2B TaxID=2605785 RepID=UPI0011DDC773|nr:winged helix-turn-helix transcriptional regulator [Eubacterium sp. BL-380-WT-2B]